MQSPLHASTATSSVLPAMAVFPVAAYPLRCCAGLATCVQSLPVLMGFVRAFHLFSRLWLGRAMRLATDFFGRRDQGAMLAGADATLWQPSALIFCSGLARVGVGSVTCGKDWQGTLQTEPGAYVRAANRSPNAVATSCAYGTKYCRFAHMLPVCCQGYQLMGKMQRPSLCTHTAVYYISQCSRILHMVLELSVMAQLAVSLSRLPFSGQAWNADTCGRVVSCRAG